MRNTRRSRAVLCVAMFVPALASLSQVVYAAVTTNAHPVARVTERVDNSKRTVLHGHVPPVISRSSDLGRLPGNTPMRHMLLVLKPSFEQDNELKKLIDQQQDKRTVNHHQWLKPEEFGERFGVHDSDIAQVKSWLAAQGLSVEMVGKNKRIIEFSGVSGQVENAFQTEMHYFKTPNGETHISANADISVPSALRPVIEGLHGLNNFFKKPRMVGPTTLKSRMKKSNRKFTFSNELASDNTIIGPNDFAKIYNTLPLLQEGYNGTGVRIGIIGQSDILMSDVQTYRQMFNLPVNNPNFVIPGEDPGVSPGDDSESDLDVEISGGNAPGATVDFTPGASTLTIAGVDLSLMYMVEGNTDDIISSSYGGCEAEDTAGQLNFYLVMSEQGAAQGQTLMVASGDSGPAECDDSGDNSETLGYAVGDNDGNAYVLSVGGTQFNEGGQTSDSGACPFTGTPTFWSANNTNGLASALSYIPEIPWNEAGGSGACDEEELWASNGGVGSAFATPAFQTNGSGAIPGLPMPGQGDPYIGDKVTSFTLSGTNTGYSGTATVTISGGGCTTQYGCNFINASATAKVTSGKVALTLTNPGQGYVTAPTVTINGTCSSNCATAVANIASAQDPANPIVVGPHRYQPDIAFNAAAEHDPTAYCSEGVCEVDQNGNVLDVGLVGGTSVAAPSYAGVQALVNQYNGGRQGMPGYVLYALATKQATTPGWENCAAEYTPSPVLPAAGCIFNDMVQGNTNICSESSNGVTCTTPTSVIGWPATEGYDYGTGLGSVNAYNLATQWSTVSFNSSATTMSLTASGITHGTSVPVTVTVTGSGTPTGDVGFILSSGSLGDPINTTASTFTEEVALTGQNAFGTLSGGTYSGNINSLPGGSYNVYARYAGDANFGSSSSTLTPVTVLPESSTLTLNTSSVSNSGTIASATTFTYGQFIWVDAIPRGGSGIGVPTGTVTISDSYNSGPSTVIATLALNSTGQAFLAAGNIPTAAEFDLVIYQNIPAFASGTHSLTASYSGDASFNSTTAGPYNFTVNKIATGTFSVASGETQITSGSPLQLTASFSAVSGFTAGGNSGNNRSPGLSGPTGTVTFTDTTTSTTLGTAAVNPTATFTATAILNTSAITTTGANSIAASYSGDSNYLASVTSPTVSVTVGSEAGTTTAVTSNANPTTLGGRPTFTATVTPAQTSGTVTFYDGTTVLGTGTVGTAHTASLRLASGTAFVAGTHSITAVYGGLATAAASVSPVFSEVVTAGTTTTQLTGVNGANVGQTVTFSAVVTPNSTSATYAPSSTVQFSVDGSPVGSPVPLYFISSANEGYALYEAQYSTSFGSPGTHTVTAQYNGDTNYPVPSVSNPQTIIISGASTTAVLYFPAPSSTLASNNVNFKWLPGSSATEYWIDVGSTAGGNNYYQSGPLTTNNLGAVVNDLPENGTTVYVTLYSFISGNWVSTAYTYNAVGGAGALGTIATPTNGSNLCSTSQTFSWTAGTPTPYAYWIQAGTSPGGNNLYDSGSLSNSTTSVTINGLPTGGTPIYVTLFTEINNNPVTWQSNAYNYYGPNLDVITSPANGDSDLSGTPATFSWTNTNPSCTETYWVDISTIAPGGNDWLQSGNLGHVFSLTTPVPDTNPGTTIYVTLYTINGVTVLGDTQTSYVSGP